VLRHGGVLRGGGEPGADRDGGDGEQRDGAFQRDDTAQRGEPGAGEPQQAERPLAVGATSPRSSMPLLNKVTVP